MRRTDAENVNTAEDKFFNRYRTSDPLEKLIVAFVKSRNDSDHFAEKVIHQIGYPRWDKIVSNKTVSKRTGKTGTDTADVYYIPFVRDSQNHVNATMVIKMFATDTTMTYRCDWQYGQKNNSSGMYSDSAEHYAIFFMMLDRAVFNHTTFQITDSLLFGNGSKKPITVRLDSSAASQYAGLIEPVQSCQNVTITWQDCPYIALYGHCFGEGGSCDNCSYCTSSVSYSYCWTSWVETGGGSGGGTGGTGGTGSGSGGSGGGSGGGGTPPPCGGGIASKSQLLEGCQPGWTPVADGNPVNPLPRYILNHLKKPCLKAALNKLSGGTTNTFFKQVYSIFDSSGINHLTLLEADLTADTAYGIAYPPLILQGYGASFDIKIDTVKLMQCSQEWMAYVLIHEVAHAAMFANVINWDTTNSQHMAMGSQYLALMANALQTSYPSLSEFEAYAICFTGFYNGIEGNPTPRDIAFSLLVANKISHKFGVAYTNAQLAAIGRQFAENGTKGLRGNCN